MERVYLSYFDLHKAPFAITPDPSFVYLSPRHQDALAHLLYGVGQGGGGGFVQLTGEVGTGKTTLCRCLLEQTPDNTRVALILNPMLSATELVAAICDELQIDTDGSDSLKQLVDRLNRYLLDAHARGERVVVVIDEAQNLSRDALEQVRLLTNLETHTDKLLQIVLLGQPELRDLLAQGNLRQLTQRITARYHLQPLNETETAAYVRHRIAVAGGKRNPFNSDALRALFRHSGGVPRLINIIADRALLAAYAKDQPEIGMAMVAAAAREVHGENDPAYGSAISWPAVAAVAAIVLLAGAAVINQREARDSVEAAVMAATPDSPSAAAADFELHDSSAAEPAAELADAAAPLRLDDFAEGAWPAMARLWQAPGQEYTMQASCAGDQNRDFACLHLQGNWQRIRALGLPVMLSLPGQPETYLTLGGLSEDSALVMNGARQEAVALRLLDNQWFGDFLVLWPQAADWPRQLSESDHGPAVAIVKRLAAQSQPAFDGIVNEQYDRVFSDWVRGFQRQHGLTEDGIVGPATLLYLVAPTINTPRLLFEWSAGLAGG